jgi:hypothetical protein
MGGAYSALVDAQHQRAALARRDAEVPVVGLTASLYGWLERPSCCVLHAWLVLAMHVWLVASAACPALEHLNT